MNKVKWETTPEISKRMSKVKTKRNVPERVLALALWHKGIRYRLNYKKLPGTPDIVLLKYQIVIFVDGEFWHGKDFETRKNDIKRNKQLWINKIQNNIEHDHLINEELQRLGWCVIRFWSKEVLNNLDDCVNTVFDFMDLMDEEY